MPNPADDMVIGALVPWFGSKRNLARRVIAELGEHAVYWEPFCGSMSILLAKPAAKMETVNDLHGDLINLARVVQDRRRGPILYRRLRRVIASPAMQEHATLSLGEGDEVDQAESYFVHTWLAMNGVAGTYKNNVNFCRRYTSNGGAPAKRWLGAVQSIPAWRRRLRQVTILNDDGIELCEKIEDKAGTVIYADPPYLAKGAKYLHDFDWLSHRRLAKALNRFQKTRVVVSYYAHPDLAAMYPGWTIVDCSLTKTMVASGRRDAENKAVAPELLLVNGPAYGGGGQ
jgi:DNA adenine methylase